MSTRFANASSHSAHHKSLGTHGINNGKVSTHARSQSILTAPAHLQRTSTMAYDGAAPPSPPLSPTSSSPMSPMLETAARLRQGMDSLMSSLSNLGRSPDNSSDGGCKKSSTTRVGEGETVIIPSRHTTTTTTTEVPRRSPRNPIKHRRTAATKPTPPVTPTKTAAQQEAEFQAARLRKHQQTYGKHTLLGPPLVEDEGKLCLVLDMDETLLHSEFMSEHEFRQAEKRKRVRGRTPDFSVRLDCGEGSEIVQVHKRAGVDKFLARCAKHFEVIVFTAALPIYAKPVLDVLDKKGIIKHRFYRGSTVSYMGENFVKDVGMFGRDMRRTLLIDNNPHAMLPQPDNAFPILSWFDDDNDTELEKTFALLMKMKKMKDIRPFLKKQFNFREQMGFLDDDESSEFSDDDYGP